MHPRFSAMARSSHIRLLLALMGGGLLRHLTTFDIGNAFTSAPAPRRIVVNQPPGYYDGTERVWKLGRNLYGQDDAGRAFWLYFEKILLKEYTRSDADPCIFYRGSVAGGDLVVIATHVDDAPCFAMQQEDIEFFAALLNKPFKKVTREDTPRQVIGMEITYEDNAVVIHQRQYVANALKRFASCLGSRKPAETPAAADEHAFDPSAPQLDKDRTKRYRSIVGTLMYSACSARPDIQFAVSKCAQGMATPTEAHESAIIRVLSYLSGTPALALRYGQLDTYEIQVYVDAEFASQSSTRRSVSGYCARMGKQAVFDWGARMQKLVTRSSTEAELIALSDNADSVILQRLLLKELRILPPRPTVVGLTQAERDEHTDELKSVDVYQDNISAISIVQDLVYTGRTKHLDIRLKFVREYVRRGALLLRYLPTRKMLADVLTKGLPARTFKGFATCLCCGGDLPK